jgi:hypothetical protein
MNMPIPDDKIAALEQALFRGNKIEAIKIHRECTGLGLKESKDAVDALEVELRTRVPEKFTAPPRGKGCLGAAAFLAVIFAAAAISGIARH